jgi:hypothetical protein
MRFTLSDYADVAYGVMSCLVGQNSLKNSLLRTPIHAAARTSCLHPRKRRVGASFLNTFIRAIPSVLITMISTITPRGRPWWLPPAAPPKNKNTPLFKHLQTHHFARHLYVHPPTTPAPFSRRRSRSRHVSSARAPSSVVWLTVSRT